MSKLIGLLPNILLKQYVDRNFSKISVEEFFLIIRRIKFPSHYIEGNDVLSQNSSVLEYMLDIDKESFRFFKENAFSKECVEKIEGLDMEFLPSDIEKFPILLESNVIRKKILRSSSFDLSALLKRINVHQIDQQDILILENRNYQPSIDDIKKSLLFFKSEKLMDRAFEKNNLTIEELTENFWDMALKNGFIPKKQYFYEYPQLRKYPRLLDAAFEVDPSVITLYEVHDITPSRLKSATQRGFVADEKDLIEFPKLCENTDIMINAMKNNPKLIVYLNEKISISRKDIEDILKKYSISKEDFENHPELTRCESLMSCLPEFILYDQKFNKNYFVDEKVALLADELQKEISLSKDKFPLLDYKFGGRANINKLSELLEILKLEIDEDNVDFQESNYQILDKIIDNIVNMRYFNKKSSLRYPDADTIYLEMIDVFNKIQGTGNYNLMNDFANSLYLFAKEALPIENIINQLNEYYNIYCENDFIPISDVVKFFNIILNGDKDYFISNEKKKILKEIKYEMRFTKKKEAVLKNAKKIRTVEIYIKTKQFEKLGISEESFKTLIEKAKNDILTNKDINKLNIHINTELLDNLINEYLEKGYIGASLIENTLNIKNKDVVKFIEKKIKGISFSLSKNIEIDDGLFDYANNEKDFIDLHYNNYIISDKNRYLHNLAELLCKIDDKTLNKILENKELIGELVHLLPFLNLFDELDVDVFIQILCNYERVRNKMFGDIGNDVISQDLILKKLTDLIYFSKGYGGFDDILTFSFGEKIVNNIIGDKKNPSSVAIDLYKKMLNRVFGNIPAISLSTPEYLFESGLYSDPERFLINKNCISMGSAIYDEVLVGNFGDVILVRDSEGKKLNKRIFLIRRGNVVQLVAAAEDKFSIEIYKMIADEIMKKAIQNNDNIDYIFVSGYNIAHVSDYEKEQYRNKIIYDNRFVSCFPHADFHAEALLLSSKKQVLGCDTDELNLDFESEPMAFYMKPRKKTSYNPSAIEMTRIRALSVFLEEDPVIKEEKSRNFEVFNLSDYQRVICGEDWYVAVKKDGTEEIVVLSNNDERIEMEINNAREMLKLEVNGKSL